MQYRGHVIYGIDAFDVSRHLEEKVTEQFTLKLTNDDYEDDDNGYDFIKYYTESDSLYFFGIELAEFNIFNTVNLEDIVARLTPKIKALYLTLLDNINDPEIKEAYQKKSPQLLFVTSAC